MSETFLRLLPKEVNDIPSQDSINKSIQVLKSVYCGSNIQYTYYGSIEFIDQGSNFESIYCPNCGAELEIEWWQEMMDAAYKASFINLNVITKCCQSYTTLNHLRYYFAAGFSRWVIEVENPESELKDNVIDEIELVLGFKIKVVWAHY